MELRVEIVAALDEHDVWAESPGIGDHGPGAHAEGFGFIAGGDADGGVGHHGNYADRAPAQLRAYLLLDGGEVGIEIDEKPVDVGTGDAFRRRGWGGRSLAYS